ncbi:MAG: substrate-binding domain-containing protein [Ruminococcus sp.]|nr:substrate-binding domain-containing protein [Ruminococcus sp.]
MNKPKRPILAVISAEANSIEQKQILKGIIEQAQSIGYDTAVISNVFNPNVVDRSFFCENGIYELVFSDDISAIILISESFVNEALRSRIAGYLARKNVPILVIGSPVVEFNIPGVRVINTSDENDIEEITDHLINIHKFTKIDLLTGQESISVSHRRIEGYRRSLEKHGIKVNEDSIHFGDFWMTSGKAMAERYLNGELPLPEAIVCANDYMAYGILDGFARSSIKVPGDVTVIGYEYIDRRTLYSPLLTTYQRNRTELGREAVRLLHAKLTTGIDIDFLTPKGKLVSGDSCTCGRCGNQYFDELDALKSKRDYEFWNLFTPLDQNLTKCQNLDEFTKTLGSFHWLLRNVTNIFFCLGTNWYDPAAPMSDNVSCRSIMPWTDSVPAEINRFDFGKLFAKHTEPAAYYFDPLFFGDKFFGYTVLRYDEPDSYDDIFRNWVKSVSNGLEFLRMKNDIRYLSKCQDLSDQRDTLTGMYNARGMERSYRAAVLHGGRELYMIMLRVCLFEGDSPDIASDRRISAIIDASKAVSRFCGNHDVTGRINENTFLCLVQSNADAEMLSDCLSSILLQHRKYTSCYGTDSFVCTAEKCNDTPYKELVANCSAKLDAMAAAAAERRLISHYRELSEIRSYVYEEPSHTFDTAALHARVSGSTGYFRSVYKQCFSLSFHKDCIAARMAKAKYLLATSTLSVMEISEKCGYLDSKYFLRQFGASAGMTPIQYRSLIKG